MNKLIKLILVNIAGLVNYNGVIKEIEAGIKGKSETRLILVALASIIYGYLCYTVFNLVGNVLTNKYLIFLLGFIISTVMCFAISFIQVGPIIFKSEDTEYLFSLPITKHQIILSKLFNVYIRNIFLVLVVMLSCIIAFNKYGEITEVLGLVYFINCLLIPFIPIIIAVLIHYFNHYIKFSWKKVFNYIIKGILILGCCLVIYLAFRNASFNNVNSFVEMLYDRLRILYPTSLLFVKSLEIHIISFVVYVFLNIFAIYIFMLFIFNNYNKICTLLKGINKSKKFVYGKQSAFGHNTGNLRKELLFIFKNKLYFSNSFSILFFITVLLLVGCFILPVDRLLSINNFYEYYNMICPFVLSGIISLGNSCINSISLEKDSRELLCTLPVKLGKVIFYKWLANVLVCSLFIVINGTILNVLFKPNNVIVVLTYVIPFIVVMFISMLSIVLDYRFVEKKEKDDGVIIKQRFINLIPSVISLVIMIVPIFFKVYKLYKNILLSFGLVCLIGFVICIVYLLINRKKLRKNLIY